MVVELRELESVVKADGNQKYKKGNDLLFSADLG